MKRKLLLRVIIILMVMVPFVSSSAYSQSGEITHQLSGPGLWNADTILCGDQIVFDIYLNNNTSDTITGHATGFQLYSPDAATWNFDSATWDPLITMFYDSNFFVVLNSVTGSGADTVGFAGFRIPPSIGIPPGTDSIMSRIYVTISCSEAGKTFCIDSSFFRPAGHWKFSTTGIDSPPTWDGPSCYTIFDCCTGIRGDVNYDSTDANILDLTFLVDRIFRGGGEPICDREADVNSDGTPANILDLTYLVDRIFRGGPAPGPC